MSGDVDISFGLSIFREVTLLDIMISRLSISSCIFGKVGPIVCGGCACPRGYLDAREHESSYC